MIFINEYDLINEYQEKPYGIHRLSMYSFVVSCLINKNRSKILNVRIHFKKYRTNMQIKARECGPVSHPKTSKDG